MNNDLLWKGDLASALSQYFKDLKTDYPKSVRAWFSPAPAELFCFHQEQSSPLLHLISLTSLSALASLPSGDTDPVTFCAPSSWQGEELVPDKHTNVLAVETAVHISNVSLSIQGLLER